MQHVLYYDACLYICKLVLFMITCMTDQDIGIITEKWHKSINMNMCMQVSICANHACLRGLQIILTKYIVLLIQWCYYIL